jgi:hypothetical protein
LDPLAEDDDDLRPAGAHGGDVAPVPDDRPPIFVSNLVYQITFPFVAVVMLREIWAKRVFGADDPAGVPRAPSAPEQGSEPKPIRVRGIFRRAIAMAAVVAFAYGPVEVKASVIGCAAIALLVWFWTAFDSR